MECPGPGLRIQRFRDEDQDVRRLSGQAGSAPGWRSAPASRQSPRRRPGPGRRSGGTVRCARHGARSTFASTRTTSGSRRRPRKSIRNCSKSRSRPAISRRSHGSAGTKRATCCCAQSSPSASPRRRIGLGQLQLVDLLVRRQGSDAEDPVELEQAHQPVDDILVGAKRRSDVRGGRRPRCGLRHGSGGWPPPRPFSRPGRARRTVR